MTCSLKPDIKTLSQLIDDLKRLNRFTDGGEILLRGILVTIFEFQLSDNEILTLMN